MASVGPNSSPGSYFFYPSVPIAEQSLKQDEENARNLLETKPPSPPLAETWLKVKDTFFLILCEGPSMVMDTMEREGEAIEYPTPAFQGYVKRSNGDWTQCTALYIRCPLLTPKSCQKAFDSKDVIKTYEYKAFFPQGSKIQYKAISIEKVIFFSNGLFAKIPSKSKYTSTEMDRAVQILENPTAS